MAQVSMRPCGDVGAQIRGGDSLSFLAQHYANVLSSFCKITATHTYTIINGHLPGQPGYPLYFLPPAVPNTNTASTSVLTDISH